MSGRPIKPADTLFYQKLTEAGLSLREFCKLTKIPYRTAQGWKSGETSSPALDLAIEFLNLYIQNKKKQG